MLRKIITFLFLSFNFLNTFSQQTHFSIIDGNDTLIFKLTYRSIDSLRDKKLLAYYKENPSQVAIHKTFYLGKQSGVTRNYFPSGTLYEKIVYQNGLREGDYSRFNTAGELVVKAQYSGGVKNGFYIDRMNNFQGRYKQGKKHGKWEFNVKSPKYKKEFYREGLRVERRQVFPKKKKSRDIERVPQISANEDSLFIPFERDTLWYHLNYVSRDSLSHPAERKAFFKKNPTILAHTKYVYNGYVNGRYKVYYPNGELYLFANYTGSWLDGVWRQFDEKGKLRIKGKYREGIKVGRWEYNLGTPDYYKEKYRLGVLKH